MSSTDGGFGRRGLTTERRLKAVTPPPHVKNAKIAVSFVRKHPLISLWTFTICFGLFAFVFDGIREYRMTPEQIAARQAARNEEARIKADETRAWEDARKKAAYEKACGPYNSTLAYVMTQNVIAARLKAPSSASFPYVTDVVSLPTGDCVWSIVAYVDAQNAFGAMIRTPWSAKIKHYPNEGTWQVLSVNIGG